MKRIKHPAGIVPQRLSNKRKTSPKESYSERENVRPAKREAPIKSNEHLEQVKLFTWARKNEKYYPHLAALYAVPNAAKRSKIMGARMKAEGLKAGVLDVHLPCPIGGYSGLWIEMKYGRKRMTKAQHEWADLMRWLGHRVETCYFFEEARWVLLDYLTNADVTSASNNETAELSEAA